MHQLLTLGSVVLAIVNVGVMWAMAHQWRYAWHCNLGLQLLWLPYDYLTSQYGLLGLGVIITFVSLKGAYRENQLAREAEEGQSSHRRPVGTQPGVPSGPAAGTTVPVDVAGLAREADLAHASVSAGASAAADRDGDDRQELPVIPRIPQQADQRTALDNQARPRLP